ncbi:arginyl-tRNA synthetase [Nocardioides albertanoniae]|uniref:Arginine--tRNA ligase n=1 Tax=Nocardioides albertanoniae TaxID=1175486 RepID=A0A543A443_9ACTN|nr:arginyl-tRNA synthetase [Nocardioides albertanoniae]
MHEHTLALSAHLRSAVVACFGDAYAQIDTELRPATRPEFGHLQSNLPLRLAGPLGLAPREIGARLLEALDIGGLGSVELAGAGFLNVTWSPEHLADAVRELLADRHLSVPAPETPQRVVVDYSSPNVAKQMHVGHLRSTVIGDALARVLTYAGHEVVRQNHLGDWGTQFGMLVEELLGEDIRDPDAVGALDMSELLALYQRAKARFDDDPGFADAARRRVVELQSGDPTTLALWQALVDASMTEFDATYSRLGVLLTDDDFDGESRYNDRLPGIVADLQTLGALTESDGAQVAYADGFTGRDGAPLPLIVRKADGGFGYAATDLATIRHRVDDLAVDRAVYVVDHRQSQHFEMVFAVARAVGWLPGSVEVQHIGFGTVLGPDGRPFKTRSGETVTLTTLLDDAEAAVAERYDNPEVVRAVANAAVKYADLSNHLARDYVFDLGRMSATTGETGPYLQYAHARVCNVLAKGGQTTGQIIGKTYAVGTLHHPAEQRLALALTGFAPVVAKVADTLEPHHLTAYLYGLATALTAFYETCPVLRSEGEVRQTRLALCEATRQVMSAGLGLLGIEAPERM